MIRSSCCRLCRRLEDPASFAGERDTAAALTPRYGTRSISRPPKLIAPYIKVLRELDRGVRVPRTALQFHSVEVCRRATSPMTPHGRAYLAWRAQEQRRLKLEAEAQIRPRELRRSRDREKALVVSKLAPGRWSVPKPYARFVTEPLGARENFKRDWGANFATSRRNKL
jgi:uncharacterized protein YifE (UPF0438 family)